MQVYKSIYPNPFIINIYKCYKWVVEDDDGDDVTKMAIAMELA